MIIQNTQHVPPYISDTIYLSLVNSEITLSKVSSKLLYKAFKSRKQVPPTAQIKFKEKFPYFSFNWNDIYSLPFIVTIETKIREFQYKVLNNLVFTNEKMFKFKMTNSPLCSLKVVKGIFVTRDRPFIFPVKCEMAIFFLVNRDFIVAVKRDFGKLNP